MDDFKRMNTNMVGKFWHLNFPGHWRCWVAQWCSTSTVFLGIVVGLTFGYFAFYRRGDRKLISMDQLIVQNSFQELRLLSLCIESERQYTQQVKQLVVP